MSYTRLLIAVLVIVPAISAEARPVAAQASRVQRQANKPAAIPQPVPANFGSFDHYPIQKMTAETPAPPQIEVLFVTADEPVVPPELQDQDYSRDVALQPVGTTSGEPAIDAPHAFVDVHPAPPRELETTRRTRAPLEDASWTAALDAMDEPRGVAPATTPRMIPKELRGRFDSSKIPVRALSDLPIEPESERSFGIVAWMIGGIAGMAILVVLISVAIRAARVLFAGRAKFAAESASADQAAELLANAMPVAAAHETQTKSTKLGRFASRLQRSRKSGRGETAAESKAKAAVPAAVAVTTRTTDDAISKDSSVHAQRPASSPRSDRRRMDRSESAAKDAVPHKLPVSVEPKALSPDSGVGPFGRALAQLQVRAAVAKRAVSH